MTNLRLAHDDDFGIEVYDADIRVANINAQFLVDNNLFADDTADDYEHGSAVVAGTLAALLALRYTFDERGLSRAVGALVLPGGIRRDADFEFTAEEVAA